ncbi:MAG TPA: FkbM family methyltransferase [Acidobacteriaceae bacterium]
MKRTPSRAAQLAFDTSNRLQALAGRSGFVLRICAKAANKVAWPLARRLGPGHLIDARVYGRNLRMPAEHPLALILAQHPQYNRPLALAATTLAASGASLPLTVVDVGANVGETIAVIEQLNPGLCTYLCVEADEEIAKICRFNHKGDARVETVQCFIGEDEGALVRLEDDGRANPSTKLVDEAVADSSHHRLVRLDTVAGPFAEVNGSLSLIKVDTEGYDFSVLRSGAQLLDRYKPALYFEWYPELIEGLGEEVWDGFDFLAGFGYEHFVFFSSVGDYYCKLSRPDHFLLGSLAKAASQNKALVYFDVFASTSEGLCNRLVELSLARS